MRLEVYGAWRVESVLMDTVFVWVILITYILQ